MKTWKRMLSLILALTMMVSCLMVSSLAVSAGTDTDDAQSVVSGEDEAEEDPGEVPEGYITSDTDLTQPSGVIGGADAVDAGLTGADEADAADAVTSGVTVEQVDRSTLDVDLTSDTVAALTGEEGSAVESLDIEKDGMTKVIIIFDSQSVTDKNPQAQAGTATVSLEIENLESEQDSIVAAIEDQVLDGESLDIQYSYTWLLNGVATEVPYSAISDIEAVDGVKSVYVQELYYPVTEDDTLVQSSGEMFGREDVWNYGDGYTGEGTVISIIDTGLETDHQNFAPLAEDIETKIDIDDIADVLEQLHCYDTYQQANEYTRKLTATDVYYNTKIAFGYNYCDESTNITHKGDSQGDHGTHVAGIAAANDVNGVQGVAYDAQIFVMKVFGANGGAYTSDLIAAIEDSVMLGADVINMSLGSVAGFSTSGDEAIDEVYNKLADTDVILAIAAGNSATLGSGNLYGYDSARTSNPDNGVVSSPSTYANAISVASVENTMVQGYYVYVPGDEGGMKITYSEGSGGDQNAMSTLYENEEDPTYEFVMIPGLGEEADYEGLDVQGKIAVVARGDISFVDKQSYAAEAGAVAILVYNNEAQSITASLEGNTYYIPFGMISQGAGAYLQGIYDAAMEAGEPAELTFSTEMASVENESAGEMSSFSSWGSTTDSLAIEPDITAPGGSIYSTLSGNTYGIYSGTSMSSPQIAGMSALIKQYVTANDQDLVETDGDVSALITALLLSTATPLSYDEDTYYSPREQGNGMANVFDAVTTTAYLQVEGEREPQAELGDDVAEKGVYEYDFNVVNFGDTDLFYDLTTTIQTEDIGEGDDGAEYMSSTPVNLDGTAEMTGSTVAYTYDYDASGSANSHDARWLYLSLDQGTLDSSTFRYDLNSSDDVSTLDVQAYLDTLVGKTDVNLDAQYVSVAAGETESIHVTVTVGEEGRAFIAEHYPNGIYVEGFTVLTALGGGVNLSIPYLAFYGSWSKAPALDGGYYWMSDEELEEEASQYYNVLWTNYAGSDSYWYPGMNAYVEEDFDHSHISISPNGDGYADTIDDMYVSLLRNASLLELTFENAETQEQYYEFYVQHMFKSFYYSGYDLCVPFIWSWYVTEDEPAWDATDSEGNLLEDGTQVKMTIHIDMGLDGTGLGVADQADNLSDTWEEIVTIDLSAPEMDESAAKVELVTNEDGSVSQMLTLRFRDNVSVAAVNFVTSIGSVLAQYAVDDDLADEDGWITEQYDITGLGNSFYVIFGDYALNESSYLITTSDNLPVLDTDLLYGFRTYDANIYTDAVYGWLSMNTDPEDFVSNVLDSEYYIAYSITAAAYAGGRVFASAADGNLYAITPGLWDEWTWIADLGVSLRTMTFDPVEECLWGYNYSTYSLYKIDPVTGAIEAVGDYSMSTPATAIACDDDGTLYGITTAGLLRTIDKTTGNWTSAGSDGYLSVDLRPLLQQATGYTDNFYKTETPFYYQQSMVYDAAAGCLYWAAFSYDDIYGGLIRIDVDASGSVKLTEVGIIQGFAEVAGLLKLEDRGSFTLPEVETLTGLGIQEDSLTMLVGGTADLTALRDPWYAENADLVWSSGDEGVATVNAGGRVTATGLGTTYITVSNQASGLSASIPVSVISPSAELYGYAIGSNLYNQWIRFQADDLTGYEALTDQSFTYLMGGEYYDGYVYYYTEGNSFYRLDPTDYSALRMGELNGGSGLSIIDMAFDYSTGYMMGLGSDSYLYYVDLMNGQVQRASDTPLEDAYEGLPEALAVSTDGLCYVVTDNSFLMTYDLATDTLSAVGMMDADVYPYVQSMTWDHNNGGLYWAGVLSTYYIDPTNGNALALGDIDGSTQVMSLYTIIEEDRIPDLDYVPAETIVTTADSILVLAGMTSSAPVSVLPYNATNRSDSVSWSVEDDLIASIDELGRITGLRAGTTVGYATLTLDSGEQITVSFDIEVKLAAGSIYGYVMFDRSTGEGGFWGTFDDNALEAGGEALAESDYEYSAGAYYNGYVYASNQSYLVKTELGEDMTFENTEILASDLPDFYDMTFDYTTGILFAVGSSTTNSTSSGLYAIDIDTGNYYLVSSCTRYLHTLACSEDGVLYAIDEGGTLYTVDKETAELTPIGNTGYLANAYQSMTFDFNSGNLYWAQVGQSELDGTSSDFLLVDPTDASVTKLGTVGTNGSQVTCLFTIPEEEQPAQQGELLFTSPIQSMLWVDSTLQVSTYSQKGTVSYTSSNPAVATVNQDGLVTGISQGSATIVASNTYHSDTCQITVLDDSVELRALNPEGWYTSNLNSARDITDYVYYEDYVGEDGETIPTMTDGCYDTATGTYYGLDKDGCLWSYQYEDGTFTNVKQIGEDTLINLCETDLLPNLPISVQDMTVNAFNGKLYTMMAGYQYYAEENENMRWWCICEIDTETGVGTFVDDVSAEITNPNSFAFTSENYVVFFDEFMDEFRGQEMYWDGSGADTSADTLAWVQSYPLVIWGTSCMTYSKTANVIFFCSMSDYKALYYFDMSTFTLNRISSSLYSADTFGLALVGIA